MVYEAPEYHPAFEEYCETIFELSEDGFDVIQARIVERLEVTRPAVSEMVRRMEREGLVEVGDSGEITLTTDGSALASQVVRRHRLAERFLTDMLDLSWAEAHHEAGKWEHVISSVVEKAMFRVLDHPTTCPHGNPIPGSGYQKPVDGIRLIDVVVGTAFHVERIPEELEFRSGQLEYLESAGVQPGRTGVVIASSPDGTTTVEIDGKSFGVGAFASARILVTSPG